MRFLRHIILILIVASALTSCGFHLRGPLCLAPPLRNLYIKTCDPYGQLARNLKQYLQLSGVHIAPSQHCATTVLDILSEREEQQLLSVGGTQQTRQYNLILIVNFQITDSKNCILVPPQTISESSTIPILSNQVLGGSNEANTLYQQMRQAIIYNIMLRLASPCVTAAVMRAS